MNQQSYEQSKNANMPEINLQPSKPTLNKKPSNIHYEEEKGLNELEMIEKRQSNLTGADKSPEFATFQDKRKSNKKKKILKEDLITGRSGFTMGVVTPKGIVTEEANLNFSENKIG